MAKQKARAKIPKSNRFVKLLGRAPDDPKVTAFMDKYGKPKKERLGGTLYYSLPAAGIEFCFEQKQLHTIHLHGKKEGKTEPFKGRLPYPIKMSFTKKEVEAALGKPEKGFFCHRYTLANHRVVITLDDDTDTVELVSIAVIDEDDD
mgnify:CR=1 FL=1